MHTQAAQLHLATYPIVCASGYLRGSPVRYRCTHFWYVTVPSCGGCTVPGYSTLVLDGTLPRVWGTYGYCAATIRLDNHAPHNSGERLSKKRMMPTKKAGVTLSQSESFFWDPANTALSRPRNKIDNKYPHCKTGLGPSLWTPGTWLLGPRSMQMRAKSPNRLPRALCEKA